MLAVGTLAMVAGVAVVAVLIGVAPGVGVMLGVLAAVLEVPLSAVVLMLFFVFSVISFTSFLYRRGPRLGPWAVWYYVISRSTVKPA